MDVFPITGVQEGALQLEGFTPDMCKYRQHKVSWSPESGVRSCKPKRSLDEKAQSGLLFDP